jgi:parallel beta-helix repeat protein
VNIVLSKKKIAILCICLSILTVSLIVITLNAKPAASTLEIPSGAIIVPSDYSTIQDAIDNADEGATIYVKKGVYVENPIVNKTVALIGEDRDATIIDVTAGLKLVSNNVVLSGFTVYDGWHCISLSGDNCTVSGNKIKDGTNGIVLFGSNNLITGNIFEAIGLSSAIQLNFAYNTTVKNNYISNCVEGIQIWQSSNNNTITENIIVDCQETAISFQYSGGNTITQNNITRCKVGTSIYGASWNIISKNNYVDNTIQCTANEAYYLSFGKSPSVNTIEANYWSDYNGIDADGDGIGDTPYVIDENNKDPYPLTGLVI